jgi:hypothetical protein
VTNDVVDGACILFSSTLTCPHLSTHFVSDFLSEKTGAACVNQDMSSSLINENISHDVWHYDLLRKSENRSETHEEKDRGRW